MTPETEEAARKKRRDRVIASLLAGLVGAFLGGLIAWATFADGWTIAGSAVVGYVIMVALCWSGVMDWLPFIPPWP